MYGDYGSYSGSYSGGSYSGGSYYGGAVPGLYAQGGAYATGTNANGGVTYSDGTVAYPNGYSNSQSGGGGGGGGGGGSPNVKPQITVNYSKPTTTIIERTGAGTSGGNTANSTGIDGSYVNTGLNPLGVGGGSVGAGGAGYNYSAPNLLPLLIVGGLAAIAFL